MDFSLLEKVFMKTFIVKGSKYVCCAKKYFLTVGADL